MAPAVASPVPAADAPQFRQIWHTSSSSQEEESHVSRRFSRASTRRHSTAETSGISNVVYSLKRRCSEELGSTTSENLLSATHDSILDWIKAQRMSQLPPEGSSHDKVLGWAQLFVERLHSFDLAIEGFAGDSYLATQLAYGYCALLLELGKENAVALEVSFGFFYNISVPFANLLERTELFSVSYEIREQLIASLSDLIRLVSSVATHFHKAIRGSHSASVSVDIYRAFPAEIRSFVDRCERTSEAMWRHQLQKDGIELSSIPSVRAIRTWLTEDRALANLANSASHLAHDREELTCLWIGPYLTRFLQGPDKILSISGNQGSGKTVLSSVISDFLEHPVGGVKYSTLFVPINSRVPAETSPRAIAKAILSQLFEKRIGNVPLMKILADAHELSKKATTDQTYDTVIWDALDEALAAALPGTKELVVIVDGIDEAICDETALFERLAKSTSEGTDVKLITLGAEPVTAAAPQTSVDISENEILDDIVAVVRGLLEETKVFRKLSEVEQETLVTRLSQASQCSFLWAKLATKRIRVEENTESFRKVAENLMETKPSIADFVSHTLQTSNVSDMGKLMLLWLSTSERPLTLSELSALASINTEKKTVQESQIDVLATLRPLNSLVFLQDGLVQIRHGLVRAAIVDVFNRGKLVPNIKDRHADLLTRLLIYIKVAAPQHHEPSLTCLDGQETRQLVHKNVLLDFAVRFWPLHLKYSSIFLNETEANLIKNYANVFPTSTTALLLQATRWQNRPTPVLLSYHSTVANICRQLLSTKHVVTLQSIILLAGAYRETDFKTETTGLYYEAATIAKDILSTSNVTTMRLTSTFIELTEIMVTHTKSEIMQKREEMLYTLVQCYKSQYGQNSEIVIATLNQLVEHYRMVKDEQNVQKILTSIRSITITEVDDRQDGDLHVHLKGKHEEHTVQTGPTLVLDVEEHDELIESSDSFDFELSMKRIEKYLSEGRKDLAEQCYVSVWQRVSREYSSHHSELWEKRKMKTMIDYSRFLQYQTREIDASSILSCAWEEYKQSRSSMTESSVSLLHEMSKVMKSVGLTSLSLSVLKQCSQYYQSTSMTQTSMYKEIEQSIRTESKEILQSTSFASESSIQQILLDECTSIESVDQTWISSVCKLAAVYSSQHRWQDASKFLKRVLRVMWPSLFFSNAQDVVTPQKHADSCVELAERLAECYGARRRVAKEDEIRVRIYRSMRASRKVDNKLRERVTSDLLCFFSRTSQKERVISTRQEMLADSITHYGAGTSVVIKMLRELAELTRPRPIFVDYYEQIVHALNKDSEICNPEAFDAVHIVATEKWRNGSFSEALTYYKVLFVTFLKQPKTNKKFEDQNFVREEIFSRYDHCLRSVRTDFEVIHRVTSEYRAQCKTVFGATASITVQATLHFAKTCQESERYESEAIAVYEELLQTRSEEISHKWISETLESIYEEQTERASSKTEITSSTQVERAISILRKQVTATRETHGWAHEESLSKLTELVKLQVRKQEIELAMTELKTSTVNILSSETSSTRLVAAATTIASNYVAVNQIQKGMEIYEEMCRQIITKDTAHASSCGFDLSSRGRESLVFLAQYQYSLSRSASRTTSEILAELTTEYVYSEQWRAAKKSKSSNLQAMVTAAARLHNTLVINQHLQQASRVFEEFQNYFLHGIDKRVKFSGPSEAKVFIETLLWHFNSHKSSNFTRSVGIAANRRTTELFQEKKYDAASDLAVACFKYISVQESYRTLPIARLILSLGMTVSGRHLAQKPKEAARKKMMTASGLILKDVFCVMSDLKVNFEHISLPQMSNIIGLLGEMQDYQTLAWLLTVLWDSRVAQRHWNPSATLALSRHFIMVKYLVGESMAAIRLAEDIVYNTRRVHGIRHPATIRMSVFLTQLYTSVALRYQTRKAGQDMANRYFKKSAGIHEEILRAFSDPTFAELEAGLDAHIGHEAVFGDHHGTSPKSLSDGAYVGQHLWLLKLAVERLGSWPKDYSEYHRLNADCFREYPEKLKGVSGVEKWNLDQFGNGKAESDDDLLSSVGSWDLTEVEAA